MTDRTATGTFTVQLVPQGEPPAGAHTRYALSKAFSGDFEGTATGEMLGWFDPATNSGAYVVIERLDGRLQGREGSFSLAHRGLMDNGAQLLSITIVPGSGTGELAGIAGEFSLEIVDGVHNYSLAYSLPSGEGQ
ncbi:MAG: DUF3224 domain-containing protein [Caulobacterales bacterium]|uniref:DUF3224 domain-containing protein n=1 Tax=Glycocaulis sp. TaxID=1969725 RepID=UPI003F9F1843